MDQLRFKDIEMWDDRAFVLHFEVEGDSGQIYQCKISRTAMVDHFQTNEQSQCRSREQATSCLMENISKVLEIVSEKIHLGRFEDQTIVICSNDL